MIFHNPLLCKLQNHAPFRIAPLGASHRKQSIDVTIRAKTESPVPIRRRQALSILFMTASTLQTAASDAGVYPVALTLCSWPFSRSVLLLMMPYMLYRDRDIAVPDVFQPKTGIQISDTV